LSKGISEFISKKLMLPMVGPQGIQFPSHTLYVDDIFVYVEKVIEHYNI